MAIYAYCIYFTILVENFKGFSDKEIGRFRLLEYFSMRKVFYSINVWNSLNTLSVSDIKVFKWQSVSIWFEIFPFSLKFTFARN